jgi:hypothetical protein
VATVLRTKKSIKSGTYWVRYFDALRSRSVERDSGQKTKALAREQAVLWERDAADHAARIRKGLLPPSRADGGGTLGELMEWWLEEISRAQRSHKQNVSVVRKHVLGAEIALLRLEQVTPPVLERFFRGKERENSARGQPLSRQTLKPSETDFRPRSRQPCGTSAGTRTRSLKSASREPEAERRARSG